ncbi:hypothetical protein BCV70DRAFT_212208 [Testicularia cyperi]|uniref:PHD-type domain-containing protein n=1 Tax=Testicularia cyperi TaxID=1882483 RepID=A0A317XM50_9BASI|nr:hypothetical protein BCV70DRAFT_212208 [Testicularia cyperi]
MASSALAATGLTASKPALQQEKQQQALLDASSATTSVAKAAAPVTRVAIRDGKMVGINDHIYLSPAWAPGAGEPYMIARVMEFVTAASSRSGAAALASSSGTLQVRANIFLRMRDISYKSTNDPRMLVATMHSDVYSLENIRGICEVRHRDLIGNGSAPDVSQWKKKDDHFYYHQLYDRYIHRFHDVIPTEKIKNAPPEVIQTLRTRYSFVAAEVGMIADLTDALRGCTVCHGWASTQESVRCDTCKKFFHMKCLNPPLLSKPAKGYSWTCAPCSRRHEQSVELTLQQGGQIPTSGVPSSSSSNASSGRDASMSRQNTQGTIRGHSGTRVRGAAVGGRGRGRPSGSGRRARYGTEDLASATNSPDGTPAPEKTSDDIRGTRCFNRWPYRYFGQHTNAMDVLDPHDSVYPIATTRLGPKYQASLPTWEEQKEAGMGVYCKSKERSKDDEAGGVGGEDVQSSTTTSHRKKGRPFKRKREAVERSDTPTTGTTTPTAAGVSIPSEPPEFERGGDDSVEPMFLSTVVKSESELDAFIKGAQTHFKSIQPYDVDLLNRALSVFTAKGGDPVKALTALSQSTPEELHIVNWTAREIKQFETGIREVNSDMRQLKKYIPSKKVGDIVRYFVTWKTRRIKADLEAVQQQQQQQAGTTAGKGSKKANGASVAAVLPKPTISRAVSPSLSIYGDGPPAGPSTHCAMCSVTSSQVWYKGPASYQNRVLCINCGLYWRKYAAEAYNTELVSVNTRNKTAAAAAAAAEDGLLGVAPPTKVTRTSKDGKTGAASSTAAAVAPPPIPKPEPLKCVMCKRIEPKKKLGQCRNCSLSVHQGCYGLTDEEIDMDWWMCDPCNNEQALEAALLPRCILCSPAAQKEATAIAAKHALASGSSDKPKSRPKSSLGGGAASAAANSGADSEKTSGAKKDANGSGVTAKSTPLSALDAFKPTECNNWAHVLCAVWMPEVVFSDVNRLKLVESCGNLPQWRYEATCMVCKDQRGACVTCTETSCRKTFHISCAYNSQPGFTIGFEIIPVKGSRREVIPTLTFKGESGHMLPQIWCKEHKEVAKTKKLYDLAEVDPKTGLTSLQMFVRTNKHLSIPAATVNTLVGETTYALLRRAKRYDSLLAAPALQPLVKRSPSIASAQAPKTCDCCKTKLSPFWWKLPRQTALVKLENGDSSSVVDRLCCNFCKETRFKEVDFD